MLVVRQANSEYNNQQSRSYQPPRSDYSNYSYQHDYHYRDYPPSYHTAPRSNYSGDYPPSYHTVPPQPQGRPPKKQGFPRDNAVSYSVILAILCFIGGLILGIATLKVQCEVHSCPRCPPPLPPIIRPDPLSGVPWPGKTYVIALRETNAVLSASARNTLSLTDRRDNDPLTHWRYHETDKGWFTLRNVATGRYLGRNRQGHIIAGATVAGDFENVETRANPLGGFGLYVKTGASRAGVTPSLGLQGQVALWAFVEVDDKSFLAVE